MTPIANYRCKRGHVTTLYRSAPFAEALVTTDTVVCSDPACGLAATLETWVER